MGRLPNRLPTGAVWLSNEVPVRRVSPRCGSKEARSPIVVLKSDVPTAVLPAGLIVWR
jgi:hypothetical protein